MSDIRTYQTAEGLDDEQMAALLSERLGRTVSPQGYRIVKGRRGAPQEWLEALHITPMEPGVSEPANGAPPSPPDDDPKPKPGTDVLPFEPASVRTQLTLVYTMAGKGAALALKAPPVEGVWAAHAPKIADAYIEWAKENRTVAYYLNILTLGGPLGNLVMLHGSMIVSSLIVAKRIEIPMPPSMRTPQETDLIDEPPDDERDSTQPPQPQAAE